MCKLSVSLRVLSCLAMLLIPATCAFSSAYFAVSCICCSDVNITKEPTVCVFPSCERPSFIPIHKITDGIIFLCNVAERRPTDSGFLGSNISAQLICPLLLRLSILLWFTSSHIWTPHVFFKEMCQLSSCFDFVPNCCYKKWTVTLCMGL